MTVLIGGNCAFENVGYDEEENFWKARGENRVSGYSGSGAAAFNPTFSDCLKSNHSNKQTCALGDFWINL